MNKAIEILWLWFGLTHLRTGNSTSYLTAQIAFSFIIEQCYEMDPHVIWTGFIGITVPYDSRNMKWNQEFYLYNFVIIHSNWNSLFGLITEQFCFDLLFIILKVIKSFMIKHSSLGVLIRLFWIQLSIFGNQTGICCDVPCDVMPQGTRSLHERREANRILQHANIIQCVKKKSFILAFQMLLFDECYENLYT
jgi:hypothetical protein